MVFTAKFAASGLDSLFTKVEQLNQRINDITNVTHQLDFDLDQSIVEKTQEMGGKVQAACGGMSKSVAKTSEATKSHTAAVKDNAATVDKATEAGKKHVSALDSIKGKYEGVTGSIGKLKSSLTGIMTLLAGGAAAGIAWKASVEATEYKESVMERLSSRKGTQKVDTEAIEAFVKKAGDSGYTNPTNRLQLTNLMINRGAKNAKYATGAADALEKIFFRDRTMLEKDYGITTSEALGEYATAKNIRGDMAKNLDYLFGKGFSSKSQNQRIKALSRMCVKIDIDAEMAEKPLQTIETRLKSINKSIGDQMAGPMNWLAGGFANILGIIDRNPILPKIIAIGAGLSVVIGTLITIVGLLPLIKSAFVSVGEGFKLLGGASKLSSMASMLMNPYVMLVALAAIILVVAYKTGYLQKAWDKFAHSAIGGDILGGIQALGDFVGVLIDKFSAWYEDSGKNNLLTFFLTLFDILGNAYDIIDAIYSRTKAATGSPLLAGLVALNSIPGALVGGAIKTFTGGSKAEDILESLADRFQTLLRWVSTTFPFTNKIHDITKKATDFLSWLYTLLQGMWNWLMGAIPGAAKESKRLDVVSQAHRRGMHLNAAGELWLDKPVGGRSTPTASEIGTRLQKTYTDWKNLPGFAEGIADAVKRGLSGIATDIANAITGSMPDFNFPDFSGLTKTLEDLKIAIENWNPANWGNTGGPFSGSSGGSIDYSYSQPGKVDQSYRYYPDKDKVVSLGFGATGIYENGDVKWEDLPKSVQDYFNSAKTPGHAKGISFKKSGFFSGRFHEPEEVIPQATAVKGPGPISRALDILYGMDGKKTSSPDQTSGVAEVHVHNENKFDFAGARFDAKFDVEAFLRKLDSRIEEVSIKAAKKVVGQRRT